MLKRAWLGVCLAIVWMGSYGLPVALTAAEDKIDQRVLRDLATAQRVPVFIVLANQADTSFAQRLPTKAEKGRAVVTALRVQALLDQPRLITWLNQRGGDARGYLSVNAVSATVDAETLQALSQRVDVATIVSDAAYRRLPLIRDVAPQALTEPLAVEVGIMDVKAPQVWTLGYTGQGIVVAGEDTGVRWTHYALKPQYRGWNGVSADHNYNWHDGIEDPSPTNPCGTYRLTAPCDDNSHGTHTVGTIIGDDGNGNQIGVAPGASWIACRNMDAGNGTISSYVNCIDWMIAPYPVVGTIEDGDPLKAPDVINNSWGCPVSEGCSGPTLDDIQPAVANAVNAGIMFVSSAGNKGFSCQTVADPPALYPETFVVGAYDPNTDLIANFSSRGPIVYDNASRIGPDIAAPGMFTRSAVINSDSAYGSKDGTSMASPHVVGVVALLWSARPELRGQVAWTRQILTQTAIDTQELTQTCGGVAGTSIPNNTWGHGKVDALAAIQPTLDGSVTANGSPSVAKLSITDGTNLLQMTIGSTGLYSTTLPTGVYTATASHFGFAPVVQQVTITSGQLTTQDFAFVDPMPLIMLPAMFKSE